MCSSIKIKTNKHDDGSDNQRNFTGFEPVRKSHGVGNVGLKGGYTLQSNTDVH
mgnify:CR=1 FL=1